MKQSSIFGTLAAVHDAGHRMWGFSVEFWSSVIVWAIIISAVAGAISIVAGFVAGIVGYRVSDLTQKETSAQIAEGNARAAEANARAAEANLALERYKAPRSIDAAGNDLIKSKLLQFAGQGYQVTTFWDLKEALAFSKQLHQALQVAGWKFIPHGSGGSFLLGGLSGIQVFVHPNAAPKTKEAADALVSVLGQLDFAPALKEQDPSTPNDSIIRLNIGTKY
jgi:hypothetical protein